MTTLPNTSLPQMASSAAQKYVTFNEAMRVFDAVFSNRYARVLSSVLSTPPGSPTDGDTYIVGPTATDAWVGQENSIAYYNTNAWIFYAPTAGWEAYDANIKGFVQFDGTDWTIKPVAASASGANMGFFVVEETLTALSGATVDTTIQIPNPSIVFNTSVLVTTAITGASSFDVGVAGNTSQFGGSIGTAQNSRNAGIIGPSGFYSPTSIRLTANGGNFTGGDVVVAIHYYEARLPDFV